MTSFDPMLPEEPPSNSRYRHYNTWDPITQADNYAADPGPREPYPGWAADQQNADREAYEERIKNRTTIDPNTGAIVGELGLIPGDIAPHYQAAHEQALWANRQRTAANAVGYMQGALGLLSSYRPGGGAAIQSGIYQNLSAAEFQRAEMMQPMDLLSDQRKQEADAAQKAASRQAQFSQIIGGIGAIASLATGVGALGGAGALLGAGAAASQVGQGGSTSLRQQGFQATVGSDTPQGTASAQMAPGGAQGGPQGAGVDTPPQQGGGMAGGGGGAMAPGSPAAVEMANFLARRFQNDPGIGAITRAIDARMALRLS